MPSMHRSSSCSTHLCVANRSRSAAASCSLRHTRPRPSASVAACRARELCRRLIFVDGHFKEYQRLGDAAISVLNDFTPLVERISIDEAFADVAGCTHLFGPPAEIASAVRRRVRTELGLLISIGAARTKHLAKIASQVAKPDGLVVVDPDTELAFLHDLPVELMWGVGPVTRARLAEINVHTIGQLPASSGRGADLNRRRRSICLHLTVRLNGRSRISRISKASCMSTAMPGSSNLPKMRMSFSPLVGAIQDANFTKSSRRPVRAWRLRPCAGSPISTPSKPVCAGGRRPIGLPNAGPSRSQSYRRCIAGSGRSFLRIRPQHACRGDPLRAPCVGRD